MSQNVIELNGKRYDAITGVFLGANKSSAKANAGAPANRGRVIDGFIRPSGESKASKPAPAAATAKPASKPQPAVALAQPVKAPAAHLPHSSHAPKILPAHKPEHAKTLMRRAVHKPETKQKLAIKPQAPAEIMAKPASAIAPKRSAYALDASRLERAHAVNKHQGIRHFVPHSTAGVGPSHAAVPVHRSTAAIPLIPVKAPAAMAAKPHSPHQPRPHADIFEAAIARATSHEQPQHHARRRKHRRLVSVLAVIGTFLVIGGFISYLNMPTIELKVATIQAGFHASMPGYHPTGYALQGGVKRSGNTVSLRFHSGDSSYTLTQQASDWNSQTLLDNTLALTGAHTTVQKNGQLIYIYRGSNAAWVNGGVRYDLTGNASLTTNDIVSIATSL